MGLFDRTGWFSATRIRVQLENAWRGVVSHVPVVAPQLRGLAGRVIHVGAAAGIHTTMPSMICMGPADAVLPAAGMWEVS